MFLLVFFLCLRHRHYQEFRDDSVVQELICDPKERGKHSNMLIDVDVTQIDAYLIVYTDDDRSKRVVGIQTRLETSIISFTSKG